MESWVVVEPVPVLLRRLAEAPPVTVRAHRLQAAREGAFDRAVVEVRVGRDPVEGAAVGRERFRHADLSCRKMPRECQGATGIGPRARSCTL